MKKAMIKTPYKGLYLTENGTAWHKASKCELKPTASGKIRFNGKLYDLQKLINSSSQKVAKIKSLSTKSKPAIKKAVQISELVQLGFKKTQICGLYVSKTGVCYNSASMRKLSIRNGKTSINGKAYNVAKIILETFCKIPVRTGSINFINGNNNDFNLENLEYKTTMKQPPPVATDLIKCIRLYFEVENNFNVSSLLYKYYLHQVFIKSNLFWRCESCTDFDLFLEYLKNDFCTSNNQKSISDKFGYTLTNGKNAINKYLNLLVAECLQNLENGILQLKDFAPKPPTKTQKLKQLQKSVNNYGLSIKIPLRKPSTKELLNQFKKKIETKRKPL